MTFVISRFSDNRHGYDVVPSRIQKKQPETRVVSKKLVTPFGRFIIRKRICANGFMATVGRAILKVSGKRVGIIQWVCVFSLS